MVIRAPQGAASLAAGGLRGNLGGVIAPVTLP
jgi:hypothetical protein